MTQNVVDFSDNPTGAGLMDDYLDKDQQNVLTCNSGITRPSYAVAGTKWLDTSATPWVLKMYDGTNDVALGTVNPRTHAFIPYGVDSKQDISNLSQSLDTSTTKYPSNKAVKAVTDTKANDNNVVHKTGDETISGIKTFTSKIRTNIATASGRSIEMKVPVDLTVRPTSASYYQAEFVDKSSRRVGGLEYGHLVSGNRIGLVVRNNNNTIFSGIHVGFDSNNVVQTQAPTPPASDNSTQIATTAWVNSRITSIMNNVGDGYVTYYANNCIRFSVGLQMCWGWCDNANGNTTKTFPLAFKTAPTLLEGGAYSYGGKDFYILDATTTTITISALKKAGWWMVIGSWK